MMIGAAVRAAVLSTTIEVSYVDDRLSSLLRRPFDQRPAVTLAGMRIDAHTILGGARWFGGDDRGHYLVPCPLLEKLGGQPNAD